MELSKVPSRRLETKPRVHEERTKRKSRPVGGSRPSRSRPRPRPRPRSRPRPRPRPCPRPRPRRRRGAAAETAAAGLPHRPRVVVSGGDEGGVIKWGGAPLSREDDPVTFLCDYKVSTPPRTWPGARSRSASVRQQVDLDEYLQREWWETSLARRPESFRASRARSQWGFLQNLSRNRDQISKSIQELETFDDARVWPRTIRENTAVGG